MTDETPQIDPRNNPESQQNEEGVGDAGIRSGQGGVIMSEAPTSEEGAHGVIDGHVTGTGGDMLAGVRATEEDSEEAVSGDTGPEHPGERR